MPELQQDLSNFLPLVQVSYQYVDNDIQAILNARIDDLIDNGAFNIQPVVLAAAYNPDNLKEMLIGEQKFGAKDLTNPISFTNRCPGRET